MADLSSNQSAMSVYIMGTDPDGVETFPIRSTEGQDLGVTDALKEDGIQAVITVGISSVQARCGALNFARRKIVTIMPTDGNIYYGYTNSVTVSTGTPIFRNQLATFKVEDSFDVWLIATADRDVRITEAR